MDLQGLDHVRNNATEEVQYFSHSIIWNIKNIPGYRSQKWQE